MTVFTIGYEGLDVGTFLDLLYAHHIETLVDVRERPYSRKPGFSKRALDEALGSKGIQYIHMVELGCPKPVRDQYREDGDWQRYTVGFLEHLASQQAAVRDLAELTLRSNCALMCLEADFNFCHRSMVAEAVCRHSGAGIVNVSITDATTE